MVSDWIIIAAMLILGAVVVLFMRSASDEEPTSRTKTPRTHTKPVPGE